MSLTAKHIIAAVATAPLPSGVAVIRLSGSGCKALADTLCPSFAKVKTRVMHYAPIKDEAGNVIDEGLWVWFKGPNSFTGEDVVEFHGHGGRAVVQAALEAFYKAGAKPAEPGEYTRRAFINGKMDLTQAEGLADLIEAKTEQQRQQALRQMNGELGTTFETWRTELMHLVAHAEAAIDFPDEELDVLQEGNFAAKVDDLLETFKKAQQNQSGQRLREGFEVAIIGKPNAGKSTLTNLLTGKETAIVSPIAGTTRDVVESHLDIAGYPVILADTAGLRLTDDVIEAEGVNRAGKRAKQADYVILLVDAADWPTLPPEATEFMAGKHGLVVVTKVDETKADVQDVVNINGQDYSSLAADLTKLETLDTILAELTKALDNLVAEASEAAHLNRQRHRDAVASAMTHLLQAKSLFDQTAAGGHFSADMLAQDLREAAQSIGQVTGRTDVEDVLDLVFSTFCIGK